MGMLGTYVSEQSVFLLTALLCLPALASLPFIEANPRDDPRLDVTSTQGTTARHDVAARHDSGTKSEREDAPLIDIRTQPSPVAQAGWSEVMALLTDRRMLVFAACAALFHLSNAAMLPLAAGEVTQRVGTRASLVIAACIVVPQAVVTLLSPWVGRTAERLGRRPILLLGWASLPLRGVLMAVLPNPFLLIALQAISGVSAAVFGVMLPLIADDVTRGLHRFNLCIGIFGLAATAGAALSTTLAGLLADAAGEPAAFLGLAFAGLAGTALVWLAMPETRSIAAPE